MFERVDLWGLWDGLEDKGVWCLVWWLSLIKGIYVVEKKNW